MSDKSSVRISWVFDLVSFCVSRNENQIEIFCQEKFFVDEARFSAKICVGVQGDAPDFRTSDSGVVFVTFSQFRVVLSEKLFDFFKFGLVSDETLNTSVVPIDVEARFVDFLGFLFTKFRFTSVSGLNSRNKDIGKIHLMISVACSGGIYLSSGTLGLIWTRG